MSAQKFEKLIDLIINEDQEKAEQLFHEIVVEKSREIYESIIAEEDLEEGADEDLEEGLEEEQDALESEEVAMEDEEFGDEEGEDLGVEGDEEDFGGEEDFGDEADLEAGDEEGEGDIEDRVIDLEDKLDQLIADFEAEMGGSDEGEEDFGGADEEGGEVADFGDEIAAGDEGDEVMEAVQLKKVTVKHGDNGAQTKSPGLQGPKRPETGAKAVKFDGSETVPTGAKKPSNAYSKGEKTDDAGNVNKVGGNAGKLKPATKPTTSQASGVNNKSVVGESKTAKRRI
jgi:hypothetical protein